jgi:hypothetical protein
MSYNKQYVSFLQSSKHEYIFRYPDSEIRTVSSYLVLLPDGYESMVKCAQASTAFFSGPVGSSETELEVS